MNDTKFSTGLFEQLGGTLYVGRPAYFKSNFVVPSTNLSEIQNDVTGSTTLLPDQKFPIEPGLSASKSVDSISALSVLEVGQPSFVIIGSGLNSIWEDESKIEWQLLQNICTALNWPEDALSFFDTDALVSEEAIYATMEEVIELGVDWVLLMDSEHPVSEQLAEGVQVVDVPDLEQMLSDPYSKQSFYQSVCPLLTRL